MISIMVWSLVSMACLVIGAGIGASAMFSSAIKRGGFVWGGIDYRVERVSISQDVTEVEVAKIVKKVIGRGVADAEIGRAVVRNKQRGVN